MLIILMELTNLLQGVCLNAELLGKLQISYLSKKRAAPDFSKLNYLGQPQTQPYLW